MNGLQGKMRLQCNSLQVCLHFIGKLLCSICLFCLYIGWSFYKDSQKFSKKWTCKKDPLSSLGEQLSAAQGFFMGCLSTLSKHS